MHFRSIIQVCTIFYLCIFLTPAFAEDADKASTQSIDCQDPVKAAQHEIKDAVGPLFANGAAQPQLQVAANRIDKFITDAAYCRIALQSASERAKPEIIGEWISLQQWLNRLANTFARSASDSEYTNWKDEYTLFAEIYEFEP